MRCGGLLIGFGIPGGLLSDSICLMRLFADAIVRLMRLFTSPAGWPPSEEGTSPRSPRTRVACPRVITGVQGPLAFARGWFSLFAAPGHL
jgi:hypothetical protein